MKITYLNKKEWKNDLDGWFEIKINPKYEWEETKVLGEGSQKSVIK